MLYKVKVMVVFAMVGVAVWGITIVHSAVISPAKCFPAEEKWVATGSCTRASNGYCGGEISWQQHIVAYNCDTTEAGTCTQTDVTFTSYPNTHTKVCPSVWVPSGSQCPSPEPLDPTDLPSENFIYASCY
ncbi:MAG: hypothetical protein LBG80_13100 [Bacteroidales bacterium]|jgi:hypothetical protein|nr:hypothetical protein [Bacteroidales bacterium]